MNKLMKAEFHRIVNLVLTPSEEQKIIEGPISNEQNMLLGPHPQVNKKHSIGPAL